MLNANYRQNLANDAIDNNTYSNVYEQEQEQQLFQQFSYKNAILERQKWHLTAATETVTESATATAPSFLTATTTSTPSTPATAENNNSFAFDCLHQNYEYVCDVRMMNINDTLANDTSEENENYTQAAAFDESAHHECSTREKEKNIFNAKDLDEFSKSSSSSSSENSMKSYDSSRSNSTSSNDLSTNSGNTGSSNNSRCSSNGNCSLDSGVYDDLRQLYLNEVELNRADEEATISELVKASNGGDLQRESSQNNRMRIAFGIILRLVLPLANGVARSIKGFRDVRFLHALKNIATSRQALTNVIAFAANTISMSLSSVQVSHRLEPLLKLMKISKSRSVHECLPDTPATPLTPTTPTSLITTSYSPFLREPRGVRALPAKPTEQPAPKCCTLNILAEPPAGTPIRADIVFIHGLHGSLVNTWKQGLWENERRPVGFERPPKLPLRPPKRPRHSRTSTIRPPHKKKRARFHHTATNSDQQLFPQSSYENDDYDVHEESERGHRCNGNHVAANDFSYICGAPEDIQFCDGLEYSFPTFRLRMNDRGRQLQAELESILHGDSSSNSKLDDVDDSNTASSPKRNSKKKPAPATPKPSANDPNYSKCWPGDWLPLDCPGVRVIAVNYTTDQYLWRPLWKPKESRTNLVQRSREMTELLIAHRVGYGHPIVWVGHSKGGLFVKQIIVDAWESGRPATAPFWRSARGVFFYSVPHRGSHLASIKAPLLTRSVELIDIEKNSKYLIDLHRRFACLYQLGHLKIEVFSFVETALTLMSVLYMRIVGVDSADPGIGDVCGIHLDHREICKPRSRECILYKELVKMINKVC